MGKLITECQDCRATITVDHQPVKPNSTQAVAAENCPYCVEGDDHDQLLLVTA